MGPVWLLCCPWRKPCMAERMLALRFDSGGPHALNLNIMRLRYYFRWWSIEGYLRRMYLWIRPSVKQRLYDEKLPLCCKDKLTIFDKANTKNFDFKPNDPNGNKQFQGTILHELTHVFIAHKDKTSQYAHDKTYDSKILKDYIKAINKAVGAGNG